MIMIMIYSDIRRGYPRTCALTTGTPLSKTIWFILCDNWKSILFTNKKSHIRVSIDTNISDLESLNDVVTAHARYLCGRWASCYTSRRCLNELPDIIVQQTAQSKCVEYTVLQIVTFVACLHIFTLYVNDM